MSIDLCQSVRIDLVRLSGFWSRARSLSGLQVLLLLGVALLHLLSLLLMFLLDLLLLGRFGCLLVFLLLLLLQFLMLLILFCRQLRCTAAKTTWFRELP